MSGDEEVLTGREEHDLVRLLAQEVLHQTAPEELALFNETAEEYFADPQRVLRPEGREEAVGSGVDLAMLTPYVLAVVTPVVQLLASMVGDAVRKEGQGSVNRLVRHLLSRRDGSRTPTPDEHDAHPAALSPDQLALVRSVALERGTAIGLPPERANLLADAIAGGIAVTPGT